ncbi:MAG: hypothetical protein K2N72_09960 [Oscillospiraceae bacterium]|nr:hypothetical protein [Oscillospiraceae bacterium]
MKQKRFWALFAVCMMMFGSVGCGGDTDTEKIDTEQVIEPTDTVQVTMQTTAQTTTDFGGTEEEIFMPEGWSGEELRNIIQINGKTLTLPTTLNKLSEYDDFSFETEFVDENHMLYSGDKVLMVYVMKNDIRIFTLCFFCDEDKIEKVLDEPVTRIILRKDDCEQAGVDVNTSCGIDFYSNGDDIKAVFGTPNIAESPSEMDYKFNDYENKYELKFKISGDKKTIPRIHIEITSCDE